MIKSILKGQSLTLPNVLKERSINFPAFRFNEVSEIAMIKINAFAFLSGRRYHSNVYNVDATFLS